MDFFSIIGTIASIGSIPLSLYLFIKNRENNLDKVKRDIVKILSYQIGDRRQLTTFEIQTVINSKTRETKIDNQKITVDQIIEDIVAETISNPLLDKAIKESIILELKSIYFKSEILESIDNIEFVTRTSESKQSNVDNIETEIKKIIKTRNGVKQDLEIQKRKFARTSESFAFIAAVTTLFASLLTFVGKEKYDNFSKPLYDFLQNNDFYIGIVVSIVTAITASIIFALYKKVSKK